MPTDGVLGPVSFLVRQRVVVVAAVGLVQQRSKPALTVTKPTELRPPRKVERTVRPLEGQELLLVGWKMSRGHGPLFWPWSTLERMSTDYIRD